MERYFNWSFSWTNWTFGVWFYRANKYRSLWGIDLGPLELYWKNENIELRKKDKETSRKVNELIWEGIGEKDAGSA